MKIIHIAALADDMEKIYDGIKEAIDNLDKNNIGKTKTQLKKVLKKMEEVRPHLKYKDRPSASGFERKK